MSHRNGRIRTKCLRVSVWISKQWIFGFCGETLNLLLKRILSFTRLPLRGFARQKGKPCRKNGTGSQVFPPLRHWGWWRDRGDETRGYQHTVRRRPYPEPLATLIYTKLRRCRGKMTFPYLHRVFPPNGSTVLEKFRSIITLSSSSRISFSKTLSSSHLASQRVHQNELALSSLDVEVIKGRFINFAFHFCRFVELILPYSVVAIFFFLYSSFYSELSPCVLFLPPWAFSFFIPLLSLCCTAFVAHLLFCWLLPLFFFLSLSLSLYM